MSRVSSLDLSFSAHGHNGGEPPGIEFAPPAMPRASANVGWHWIADDSDAYANTLFVPWIVPAGTQGIRRATVHPFEVHQLFGSAREVALVFPALPFHGTGPTLRDAQEDIVAAIEETLEELEQDLRDGIELSPQLDRALSMARHIFGVEAA